MVTKKQEQEQDLINIRRSRIAELLAKGYTSQVEISRILNISESSVSRDIDYLKQAAQRSLKEHIELRIPHQYSICETGLKIVLRRAYDIANNPNNTTSENIQSLSLIANIYGRLMELSTDEKTIAQAVSWIERKKEQLMQELQKEVQEVQQQQRQEQGQEQESQDQSADLSSSEQDSEGTNEEIMGDQEEDGG
jgi:DNA-binding Lrp family transcriptional regulator